MLSDITIQVPPSVIVAVFAALLIVLFYVSLIPHRLLMKRQAVTPEKSKRELCVFCPIKESQHQEVAVQKEIRLECDQMREKLVICEKERNHLQKDVAVLDARVKSLNEEVRNSKLDELFTGPKEPDELDRLFPEPWREAYTEIEGMGYDGAMKWFMGWMELHSEAPPLSREAIEMFVDELVSTARISTKYREIVSLFPTSAEEMKRQTRVNYLVQNLDELETTLGAASEPLGPDAIGPLSNLFAVAEVAREIKKAKDTVRAVRGLCREIGDTPWGS